VNSLERRSFVSDQKCNQSQRLYDLEFAANASAEYPNSSPIRPIVMSAAGYAATIFGSRA
jgi:hypothetical protein